MLPQMARYHAFYGWVIFHCIYVHVCGCVSLWIYMEIYIYIYLYVSLSIYLSIYLSLYLFPGGSVVKNLPANAGDVGDLDLIPGSESSPGRENGKPLQHSCLDNPMDRGAWQPMVSQKVRHNRVQVQCVCVHAHHEFFIHSSMAGHLCYFHILAANYCSEHKWVKWSHSVVSDSLQPHGL